MSYARTIAARVRGPLPTAVALAAGIALASVVPHARALGGLLACALLLALRARRGAAIALALGALVVGLLLGTRAPAALPHGVTLDDRSVDRVIGDVAGPVVATARGGSGARLDALDGGSVWLWSDRVLAPGQRVAASGRARSPRAPRGPGLPARRGPRGELVADTLVVLADDPGALDRVWRWAARTQAAWSARIDDAGGDASARAALRGIVTGDRSAVPGELDARWRAVGIFHVLSVSGLHLAVIAGLAFALLRRAIAASPWGGRVRPARWAAPPALLIAIAYTLVTGAQLATLRALIVIALVLAAAFADRPVRLLDALGVAAIAILLARPDDLFDPSFQLSFTAAIVLALVRPPALLRGWRGWIVRGATTSAWVTIATAPITAYHFHQIAPSGVLGNLVLTPVLELLALPLALAGIALGALGAPLVRLATELVGLVDRAAELGAHAAIVGRVAVASPIVLVVLVAISIALVAARRRALGWLVLCATWSLARAPAPAGALRVTFLDVGQGDAALVELPDGDVWLVDAGGNASAQDLSRASAPGTAIDRALAATGHDHVDLAIVSHPHPDHYLGLAGMASPIGTLWSAADGEPPAHAAPSSPARPSFAAIADALAARGTRVEHPPLGIAAERAGVALVVWGPRFQASADAPVRAATDPVRSVNDNSLVVELRFAGRSIVFAGDLELEGEEALVAAGLPHADVVKVAHHGSPTSSSAAFVARTAPALAVISCGRGNTFGFPSRDVVARWTAAGARVARTDRDGAVSVVVDSAGGLAVTP